jgi:hypothetical protein
MRRASLLFGLLAIGCASEQQPAPSTGVNDTCIYEKKGRVSLLVDAEPIEQSRVTAKFATITISSRAPKCTVRQIAGCTVTECVRADPTGTQCIAGEAITTAGPITVSGGDKPALTMNADGKQSYAGFSSAGTRWAPGTEVTVDAEGSTVPAFNAKLTFPSRVAITGPPDYVAKKNPIPLDWKTGVPLTWTPGVGTVYLHLTQGDPELRKQTDIECEAESSAGAYTIPSDTLAQLEGTRDTNSANATVEVAGRARVELKAGEFNVLVEALHREEPRYLVLSLEGAVPK